MELNTVRTYEKIELFGNWAEIDGDIAKPINNTAAMQIITPRGEYFSFKITHMKDNIKVIIGNGRFIYGAGTWGESTIRLV